MHAHIIKTSSLRNGKKENGDKWVAPMQRPPPIQPAFAPLRVPVGRFPLILYG